MFGKPEAILPLKHILFHEKTCRSEAKTEMPLPSGIVFTIFFYLDQPIQTARTILGASNETREEPKENRTDGKLSKIPEVRSVG